MSILTSWPRDQLCLSDERRQQAVDAVEAAFSSTLKSLKVDIGLVEMLDAIYVPLGAWLMERKSAQQGPLIIGINGAQGAGKSTLFTLLEVTLSQGFGQRVVGFSLDDLYKTRADRQALAERVHPLFATRGVPGTHDVDLGVGLLQALKEAGPGQITKIPVFDKSIDERCPEAVWQEWLGPADVVVLDGWCLGALPEDDEALANPINALEAEEDPDGTWRRYVNEQLKGPYSELFEMLDVLLMLKVPSMEAVYEWRTLQEKKLAERVQYLDRTQQPSEPLRIMDEAQIRRFIMHYERLTRLMLAQMPGRADVTLHLNNNHKIHQIQINSPLVCNQRTF
ncbi:hypothetical protein [Motiliproteus sp. SC1-56]|uniref:hypothetical protein n=1 Tax=Motiliproteus sp. SC1-56 TaxID=2799565 RepID=UPI001A8CED7B|nr:hypothetical protein [Motiliproteus sp. SC1-56]